MLTSISPLGERARGHRWGVTASVYVVASLLGGATTGAVLGLIGSPLHPTGFVLVAAAVVCAVAAALDLAHRLPTGRRQVDEDWLVRYRGWVYAAGFGYQLGLGVVTIVTSAATYAALGLCLLSGSLRYGLLIGACFGLARALPLLGLRDATTPERLRTQAARLERLASRAAAGTTAALVGAALVLATSAVTS